MEPRQLRAFQVVAETGNVTRASEKLHTVQPAVTRQLQLLENELGVRLFHRARRGMELTEAGVRFMHHATRMLDELDRARAALRPQRGAITGLVAVGLLPSTSELLSVEFTASVASLYPGIRLRLLVGQVEELQHWMDSGQIDVTLRYGDPESWNPRWIPLVTERAWFIGLPGSGLHVQHPISLRQIVDKPMVLPSAPHGLRTLLEEEAAAAGRSIRVVAETADMGVQKALVLGGHGFTVIPSGAVAREVACGTLEAAPLMQPDFGRTIVLEAAEGRSTRPANRATIQLLLEIAKNLASRGDWAAAPPLLE